MDIFKSKKQTQVEVTSFTWVEEADGKNYFYILYKDSKYESKFRDYVNFPYPEKLGWVKPENLVVETQKALMNLINHVGARYQNFLSAFYEKNQIAEAYKECIMKALPYIADTDDLAKVIAQEDWAKDFHTQLRNAVGCFLSMLQMETCSAKLYLHFSWDGKYNNPTNPNSLTVLTRTTKGADGKWVRHAWDYDKDHQIFYNLDGYNAQYPLQVTEHVRDVVGLLADTITNGAAENNKNLCNGECTSYALKYLTRLKIQKKPATAVPVDAVEAEEHVDAPDEW